MRGGQTRSLGQLFTAAAIVKAAKFQCRPIMSTGHEALQGSDCELDHSVTIFFPSTHDAYRDAALDAPVRVYRQASGLWEATGSWGVQHDQAALRRSRRWGTIHQLRAVSRVHVRGVLGEDRQQHGGGRARRAYYFAARSLVSVAKPVLRRRRRTRLRVSGSSKRRGSVDLGMPFVRQR